MVRKYIPIDTAKQTRRVFLDDIIYIEKKRRQVILITKTENIIFYSTMDDVKKYMDERFLFCHRSYLFNMDKILRMEDQTIHMEQDYKIFLGRECFRRARNTFREYLKKGA